MFSEKSIHSMGEMKEKDQDVKSTVIDMYLRNYVSCINSKANLLAIGRK